MLSRIGRIYHEFSPRFWFVVAVSFIDGVGHTLLFPFFALYITQHFDVGMTEAGMVFGVLSIFSMIGNTIGGALTDRFGRRYLIVFGLSFSAIATLILGLIDKFILLYPVTILIGLLSNAAGPAHHAMIADLLPSEKRQEGFGILRVVGNLAWIVGPTIGGFVANRSFFALFVIDAVVSSIVALLFLAFMPETKPQTANTEHHRENMLRTFVDYGKVLKDRPYVAFLAASMLMVLVYQQLYNSLSVYLRDNHGIGTQAYGFLMTSSAITVVLFQFSITRSIKRFPPFLTMAGGVLFYVIGFSMFGFVSTYWLFVSAVVIITIGEMIIMPTSSALNANFAPADMRGRYMAVYSLSWSLPAAVGPTAAGLILDNLNPNLLWYVGGFLTGISALGFYLLHLRFRQRAETPVQPEEGLQAAAD